MGLRRYSPVSAMRAQDIILFELQSLNDESGGHYHSGEFIASRVQQRTMCHIPPKDIPYLLMPFVSSGDVKEVSSGGRRAYRLA